MTAAKPGTLLLDEAGLTFGDESVRRIEELLAELTATLEESHERALSVLKSSFVMDVTSPGGVALFDLLFSRDDIDRDLRLGVTIALDRMVEWDDIIGLPQDIAVADCGGRLLDVAPSIARASSLDAVLEVGGVLTTSHLGVALVDQVIVIPGTNPSNVFFVAIAPQVQEWCRYWLRESSCDEAGIHALCWAAFPNLDFAEGVWSQVRRFKGGLRAVREELLSVLSMLNDKAPDAFRDSSDPAEIAARINSDSGIVCSPESPKTRANKAAMKERDAEFAGKTVRCEWHAKLSPTVNRIHFRVLDDRVLVGIYAEHLST